MSGIDIKKNNHHNGVTEIAADWSSLLRRATKLWYQTWPAVVSVARIGHKAMRKANLGKR